MLKYINNQWSVNLLFKPQHQLQLLVTLCESLTESLPSRDVRDVVIKVLIGFPYHFPIMSAANWAYHSEKHFC